MLIRTAWLSCCALSCFALVGAVVVLPCQAQTENADGDTDGDTAASRDEEARSIFEAGRTAFQAGRFEAALRRFREAYDLSGRTALLFNIATAADRARHDQEALDAYQAYIDAEPTGQHSDAARQRIPFLGSHDTSDEDSSGEDSYVTADSGAASTDDGGGVAEQWWFWTLIAVLVVGAGVGIGVGVVFGSDPQIEDPLPGTVGGVVITLGDL